MPLHPRHLLSVALVALSCSDLPPGLPEAAAAAERALPGAVPAPAYNLAFTASGPGWTGGDQGISVEVPEGRTLWLFGDSFIGTVAPDRSRPPGSSVMVRNAAVLQSAAGLQTLVGAGPDGPEAWLKPPEPDLWYWPQDGFVHGGDLYLVCLTMRATGTGGVFGFAFVRNDLVRVDLATWEQTGRVPYPSAGYLYGAEVLEHAGYRYVYGIEERAAGKRMVISRIPAFAQPGTVPPAYWDGAGWSADPAAALPMLDALSTIYSVFPAPDGDGFRLLSQEDFLSDRIHGWRAPSPEGPFTDKTLLLRTPQDGGDRFTYNAIAHPHLRRADGSVLVSWSSNSFDFTDLFEDADAYRPWFAWVPLR